MTISPHRGQHIDCDIILPETSYETTPKWHGFLMTKLAALAAGGRAEQRTAEYRRMVSLRSVFF